MDYLIASGDTLSGIARANKLGIQDILKLNPQITDPNRISAGQSIKLPGASTPITTTQPTTSAINTPVPNFQGTGATVTSDMVGAPITRNDLRTRRQELEKIATQRQTAEQEQQALFNQLAQLQQASKREQELSQNVARSTAEESKILRDLTLERRNIERNQAGRLQSGVNIASQLAETSAGRQQEDLLYKRLVDSSELKALSGIREADVEATKTSIAAREKLIDRALGIEQNLTGLNEQDRKNTRQTLLDIVDFSQGSTFDELSPAEQEAIANTAQLVGVPLSSVQQAMARNKTALNDERRKIDASIQNQADTAVSGYNKAQLTKLSSINSKVASNPTYKRFESLGGFIDNVNAALAQGNGVSDIAAINQYQKVIDEGAVTRDQDVALLRSANSLRGSLVAKINDLAKGEKLTEAQRQQMRDVMSKIYAASKAAVSENPFIKSQLRELELGNIKPEDTIFGSVNLLQTDKTETPPASVVFTGKIGGVNYEVKKK